MVLDPVLSVIITLLCGVVGGLLSKALRLPRIVMMIVLGVALAPLLHPSFVASCASSPGSVSGATTLRSFALLVALARGGLTMLAGPRRATTRRDFPLVAQCHALCAPPALTVSASSSSSQ